MYDEEHEHRLSDQMADINAAPSSTEPAAAGYNVNATEVQTRAQEAGAATVGEPVIDVTETASTQAYSGLAASTSAAVTSDNASSTTTGSASVKTGSADAPAVATLGESPADSLHADIGLILSEATGDAASASRENPTSIENSPPAGEASSVGTTSTTDTTSGTNDAPAVAASGEGEAAAASAAIATLTSNAADSVDAGIAGGSASVVASEPSYSVICVQVDDEDVLRRWFSGRVPEVGVDYVLRVREIKKDGIVTDVHMIFAPIERSHAPGEPPAAHRWMSLLEGKLTALEHDARDELLDVARQLREAL